MSKKIISAFLAFLFMICLTTPAYASAPDEEAAPTYTLEEYQQAADAIFDAYGVKAFTQYRILEIPDESMKEYCARIQTYAQTNASALARLEKEQNAPIQPRRISPRIIIVEEEHGEIQNYDIWFNMYAEYIICRPDGADTKAWVNEVTAVLVSPTYLSTLVGYTFVLDHYTYSRNSNGTANVKASGEWQLDGREYMNTILECTFGAKYL